MIITFSPRPTALRAYSEVRAGERWAEEISTSKGTPNFSSVAAVSFITGKSESLPIRMPTKGVDLGFIKMRNPLLTVLSMTRRPSGLQGSFGAADALRLVRERG